MADEKNLKVQRIELVDEHGKNTLVLDGKHGIRLVDEEGRPKASLAFLTTGQPALMFFDGLIPRVDLRLESDGDPSFTVVGNRQLDTAEILIRAHDKKERRAKKAQPASATTPAKRTRGCGEGRA